MIHRLHYHYNRPKLFGFNSWEIRRWGDDEETSTVTSTPQFYAQPEFAESTSARKNLSTTLEGWGPQNNYGIIEPNYENIYQNAKKRLSEYYFGSPMTGGGVAGRIASSAARRNVSDSPAADILKGRMGVEQANKLGDISTEQDIARATAAENARTNWISSMYNLAGMKPAGQWGGTTTTTGPSNDNWLTMPLSYIGAGAGTALGNRGVSSFLDNLWNKQKTPTTPSSIRGYDYEQSPDWANISLKGGSMIPGPQQPFVQGASMLYDLFGE